MLSVIFYLDSISQPIGWSKRKERKKNSFPIPIYLSFFVFRESISLSLTVYLDIKSSTYFKKLYI